jgi:hypothetical protein
MKSINEYIFVTIIIKIIFNTNDNRAQDTRAIS